MGYALIHIPSLGPHPQAVVTLDDYVPHYYLISTDTPAEVVDLEAFIDNQRKSHLFDVLTRIDGKLALMVTHVQYPDIAKMVDQVNFIRSNINVTNILSVLKKEGLSVKPVKARRTSSFWSEYQRNEICAEDFGIRAEVEGKDKTFLQIDASNVHGYKKLAQYSTDDHGIDLGYFYMYEFISNDKEYFLLTEIQGRGHRTMRVSQP